MSVADTMPSDPYPYSKTRSQKCRRATLSRELTPGRKDAGQVDIFCILKGSKGGFPAPLGFPAHLGSAARQSV